MPPIFRVTLCNMISLLKWLRSHLAFRFDLSSFNQPISNARRLFETIDALKVVLVLAAIFAAVVTLPDQTLELYRHAALSISDSYHHPLFSSPEGYLECVILVISVTFVAVAFCELARLLLKLRSRSDLAGYGRTLPLLIACTPYLAMSFGLTRAAVQLDDKGLSQTLVSGAILSLERGNFPASGIEDVANFEVASQLQINWWLHFGSLALLVLAALFLISVMLFFNRSSEVAPLSPANKKKLIIFGFAAPVVLCVAFVLFPVSLPRAVTPFGITSLFFAVVSIFIAAVAFLESWTSVPLFFLLIASAIGFSFLNDNHGIRQLPATADTSTRNEGPKTVGDGFLEWVAVRRDRNEYQQYPVYVVAAEGGGIYAAFRTATFLTSLQDACPRFSEHLFAISSVSGGSVGAAIFSGLIRKIKQSNDRFKAGNGCIKRGQPNEKVNFTNVAESILKDDFLSPVLAAFLFPDFLHRFLLVPLPLFDHSVALERSLEYSWETNALEYQQLSPDRWIDRANPLQDSFGASWSANADAPALFMNTTEVGCGRGRVIAPLAIDSANFTNVPLQGDGREGVDLTGLNISMSTAAVLSARFPWLTPPGWFYETRISPVQCGPLDVASLQKTQLVDGGYIDNSGVLTSLNIINEIEAAVRKSKSKLNLRITLIVLTSRGFTYSSDFNGDYLAPFQVLLSTRAARGELAVEEAELRVRNRSSSTKSESSDTYLFKSELQGFGYPLPLGWQLSPLTRLMMLGENGDPRRCPTVASNEGSRSEAYDCSTSMIYGDLNR
jgi:hypothetical protein